MEFKAILGLIIAVAIVLLVVLLIVPSAFSFKNKTTTDYDFRSSCNIWQEYNFECPAPPCSCPSCTCCIEKSGVAYDMAGICATHLGLLAPLGAYNPSDKNWISCKDCCQGRC